MAMNYKLPIFSWDTPLATVASDSFNPALTEEAERLGDNPNPYVPITVGKGTYGGYGSVQPGEWDLLYSDFQTQLLAYSNLYSKAIKSPWWLSKRAQKDRLGALEAEGNRLSQTYNKLNGMITDLGLEGTVPPLEDYSKETMGKVLEEAGNQAAENKASSLKTALKTAEYAGLAFDTVRSIVNDNRDVYDGKHGNIAQGLDSAGDTFANAAMASGNPWAMAAGAAYKGMSLLNQAIGHSTDGMTKTDAILDSNLGFASTLGLNKLNAKFGTTTDKFDVDTDLQAEMGASYMDTYGDFEDAASKAGKRYGWLSRGAARRAQNEISMANYRLDLLLGINDQSQDREAAAYYEGIGIRNLNALTGGFRSARAARKGIKFNLDFAHKVVRAQDGIRFNMFDMIDPESVSPEAVKAPDLVPPVLLDANSSANPYGGLTEYDLINLGIKYKDIDSDGFLVYSAPSQGVVELIAKNHKLTNTLLRKYGAKGIRFEVDTTLAADTQNTETPPSLGSNSGLLNGGLLGEAPSTHLDVDLERLREHEVMKNALISAYKQGVEDFDDLVDIAKEMLAKGFCKDFDPKVLVQITLDYIEKLEPINGYQVLERGTTVPTEKKGGTFTFTPYTDEQVNKFKAGGSFNVIPEGALHKNKHHMEGAEGLTKKGIPVVTEEDGKKVQQAEIEVNEIIFRLEVTEKLEKLAKEDTDNAALEAGKLITEEILHNTHDNTGLIKETV